MTTPAEPLVFMYPEKANGPLLARLPLNDQHHIEFFNEAKMLRCHYVSALAWSFSKEDEESSQRSLKPEDLMALNCPAIHEILVAARGERLRRGWSEDLPGIIPPAFPTSQCSCCEHIRFPKQDHSQ